MKKQRLEAFDYGRYDDFYADPRVKKILKDIDKMAISLSVEYRLVGGLSVYLHAKNPPEDFPDIDILIPAGPADAKRLANAVRGLPKYHRINVQETINNDTGEVDSLFASLLYDDAIQVDIFTSFDEPVGQTKRRMRGVDLKQVELLIVEKLITEKPADSRAVLDLLAYADYDKRLLATIVSEYRETGRLNYAMYWARRMATGRLTKEGIDAVVKRLSH